MSWDRLVSEYTEVVLQQKRQKTIRKTEATLNRIDRVLDITLVDQLDEAAILELEKSIRKDGFGEYCVKGHLTVLRTILRWGHRKKLVSRIPDFDIPKPKNSRGRPLTEAEYQRMLDTTPQVVGKGHESWQFLITGLWFSGLRITEACLLSWDDDTNISVDMSGKHPAFFCRSGADKKGIDRLFPIAPEFCRILWDVPVKAGFVFNPQSRRPKRGRPSSNWVSRIIAKIGAKAEIEVAPGVTASAHDLRRSFGFRWAYRVLPNVLMELMRHDDIATTQQFYVKRNTEAASAAIWGAFESQELDKSRLANESANTPASDTIQTGDTTQETPST